jgi:hypothetical protein
VPGLAQISLQTPKSNKNRLAQKHSTLKFLLMVISLAMASSMVKLKDYMGINYQRHVCLERKNCGHLYKPF